MRILVTGADGFIGKSVCRVLEEKKIQLYRGSRTNFNLTDLPQISEFLLKNKITHVIHLAAHADCSDNLALFESNIEGLYNLLLACKEAGVKSLVFASGNNVYGEENSFDIEETLAPLPSYKNTYALSKYVGELLIEDALKNTDIRYCILRISDVYGPNQRFGNLIKAIVKSVKEGLPLKLYGEGKRTRDYIYVEDVARGLVFSAMNNISGIYNLSTGIGTDVNQLVKIAAELSGGKCPVEKVVVENEDSSRIVLNPQKLNDLGFETKIDIKEGLRRCVDIS